MVPPKDKSAKICLDCGYDLDHLTEPQCPECGRGFDPKDGQSYRRGNDDDVRLWVAPSPADAKALHEQLETLGIGTIVDGDEIRVAQADVDRAKRLLKEPVDEVRCPRCESAMTPGYVWAQGGEVGAGLMWAAGIPAHRKFWGYKSDDVFCGTVLRKAHRCRDCDRLLIEPGPEAAIEYLFRNSDQYATECLACGKDLPGGVSLCPACGWSYDAAEERGNDQ